MFYGLLSTHSPMGAPPDPFRTSTAPRRDPIQMNEGTGHVCTSGRKRKEQAALPRNANTVHHPHTAPPPSRPPRRLCCHEHVGALVLAPAHCSTHPCHATLAGSLAACARGRATSGALRWSGWGCCSGAATALLRRC